MTKEIIMEPDEGERKMSVPVICHDFEAETSNNKLFQRRRMLRESEGIQLQILNPIGHGRSCSFRNRPRSKLLNVECDRQRRSSLPSSSANLLSVSFDSLNRKGDDSEPLKRVRSFKTTSKGGIINRGDSFKRSSTSINSQGSIAVSDIAPNQNTHIINNSGPSNNRVRANSAQSKASSTEESVTSSLGPTVYNVAMLGGKGVGKASLTKQFMTSEFVAFENDQEEGDGEDEEKNVTVLLNAEESTLHIVNKPMDAKELSDLCFDAFAVVYSITDRCSYQTAVDKLYTLRYETDANNKPIILIANKIDLVRKRKVTKEEARAVAKQYGSKYIETSANLNHHVDELLVGILSQIRIKQTPGMHMEPPTFDTRPKGNNVSKCALPGAKRLLNFIFKKQTCKTSIHECEDLFS